MTVEDFAAADPRPGGAGRALALLALFVALVAALLVVAAGPGTRFGWWHFRTGFKLLQYGAYAGIAAVILAVIALAVARTGSRLAMGAAILAILFGAGSFLMPWSLRRSARGVPPIHDVTTDFTNPPELTFSRAMRDSAAGNGGNGWQYEGDSIATQQRKAYPDVRPLMLAMSGDEAYRAALRTAREMGWEIVTEDPAGKRIEAVAETKWFGFKDDVSIRISPASGISRLDIRSVSRVGKGDVGANAARIRGYLAKMRENYRSQIADAG